MEPPDIRKADRLRADAKRAMDEGDPELGWYLYGRADQVDGYNQDPALDEEYSYQYHTGYYGGTAEVSYRAAYARLTTTTTTTTPGEVRYDL